MHLRARHILTQYQKRKKIFPVLALVGARQVGKSTFLRDVWGKEIGAKYVTFDRQEPRDRASRGAEHFLFSETNDLTQPLIIDEAHKVPELLDSLKVIVDERKPFGIFSLSGSVEFSKAGGVRETLTGRMGILRLYPFTVREAHSRTFAAQWLKPGYAKKACLSTEIEMWLERGGMPGVCRLRSSDERGILIEELLNSICYRDLFQLRGAKYDGALAYRILQVLARSPGAIAAYIAKKLNSSSRKVEKHLEALEALFILHRLDPYPLGVGKSRYFIFDAAMARHLGAHREDVMIIFFLNELLAQYEYQGYPRPQLYYYRSRNGSEIDLIVVDKNKIRAVQIESEASIGPASERALERFLIKVPEANGCILAPIRTPGQGNHGIQILPWISVV